jgi:hypothetical protein
MEKILIIPLPKKHHITSLLDTRPIALLETCLKILTGIINARTLKCWVKHKTLHPAQYAFIPGSSSADPVHIARCVYEISNERIKQKMLESNDISTFIHVAYLDVAKAYDSVEHTALNISLRSLGVPEGILNLLLEIDKGCTVTTKTPYGYSPEAPLGRGARQGDPFSCLRFNAFMNGLLRHLDTVGVGWSLAQRTKINAQMFADDSWLAAASKADLQKLLNATHQFFQFFAVKVNHQKSFYTTNDPDAAGNVYFRGADDTDESLPLERVNSDTPVRYLGFKIALNLDWNTHIDEITEKLLVSAALVKQARLTSHDATTAINAVLIGRLNYLLQVITPTPAQLSKWDSITLDAVRSKVHIGKSQPLIQIYTPSTLGGIGLRLPSLLVSQLQISDTHARLADSSIASTLTWHRLRAYSTHRNFNTCALRFPQKIKRSRTASLNHMHHVSDFLAVLGWSLDTDKLTIKSQAK